MITAIVLATVLVAIDLTVAPVARACACGGFVASDGEQIAANAEYAVLSSDGTTEQMILSMNARTVTKDAALLIPTPTPATADLAETGVFDQLRAATAPEIRVQYAWWPDLSDGMGSGAAAPGSPGGDVRVLSTRRLGPLEVTVLAASDADRLTGWLRSHHYVMRAAMADALRPYVDEGWYYTAIRLTTDAKNLSGALHPVRLTFRSERLVYPMRLSVAARESQFVRTYVFADHQVRRTDSTADGSPGPSVYFAGPLPRSALTAGSLRAMQTDHPYLTVIDQYVSRPSEQIVSDFTFAPAARDVPYRQVIYRTRMRTILGVPAGPAIVTMIIAGALGSIALTAVLISRRRQSVRR